MEARAGTRQPRGVGGAMGRYGWSARDVAQRFGVSERTARRWRQQDRIPERRREDWRQAITGAARGRLRARMARRGLSGMSATGTYFVSPPTRYRANSEAPVRALDDNKIDAAAMRDYFSALDRGDAADADRILNDALGKAYGAPTTFVDADSVWFDV
jgi:hypothetical protein